MSTVDDFEKGIYLKKIKKIVYSEHKSAIMVMLAAFVLWGISLCLTGFMMNTIHVYSGLKILMLGVLFGWNSVAWWSVYANIVFLFIVYKIYHRIVPRGYLFIILLCLGLITVHSLITNDINMSIDVPDFFPQSWGWGAILWLFSLSLTVISGLLIHHKLSTKFSYIIILLLLAGMLTVLGLTFRQRQKANDYELSHYFPRWDIAFTAMPLSGFSSKSLTEGIANENTVEVVFYGEIEPLVSEDEDLYPSAYWQHGKYWRKYQNSNEFKTVSYEEANETRQPIYRIEFRRLTANNYLYTLYDIRDNHVMYKQPFTKILNYWGREELSPSPYCIPREIIQIDHKKL